MLSVGRTTVSRTSSCRLRSRRGFVDRQAEESFLLWWVITRIATNRLGGAVFVIQTRLSARPADERWRFMSRRCMRILWVENHPRFVSAVRGQFLAGHALTVVPWLEAARVAALG